VGDLVTLTDEYRGPFLPWYEFVTEVFPAEPEKGTKEYIKMGRLGFPAHALRRVGLPETENIF
jgi:hypothetical protein